MPSKKDLKTLTQVVAYLTPEEMEALNELAKDWGTTKSGAIKEAIKAALLTQWEKRNTRSALDIYKKAKAGTERDEEPDNYGETEEKTKTTIFRNETAKPRRKKTKAKSLDDEENGETEARAVPSADEPGQDKEPDELERLKAEKKALRNAWIDFEIDEIDYLTRAEELDRKIEAAENGRTSQETPTEKPKAKKADKAKEAERKAKAEAKREKEEAEKAAAEENARIDQAIEKAKAKAEAGEITAEELKAEIERLNDERPF